MLGCSRKATHEEIKRAYHVRLLQFHPDKNEPSRKDGHEFHRIREAWQVLGRPQLRKEYDAACRQEELEKESDLVYAHLSPDELEESVLEKQLFYRCRCGDRYYVEREELREANTVLQVMCDGCTLVIIIET